MRRLSLRDRVTLASCAVLATGLLAISAAVNVLLHHGLYDDANNALRERAAAQLAALIVEGERVRVNWRADDAVLDELSWVFVDGRAIERSHTSADVDGAAMRLSRASTRTRVDIDDRARLLAQPVVRRGRQLATIVVGVSLQPYRHTERLAVSATAFLAVFLLLVGALVARRAVAAALRPVAEMSDRAAEWSAKDLHRRFGLGPPHDEITGLAATLDGLLARIGAALRHEQRFSAEMAHELRTPLSGVRAEAELALRGAREPELREALERIVAATDRMAAVIQTLLATARGQDASLQLACTPAEPIQEVVDAMRSAADANGVRIDVREGPREARVMADPGVVAQAFQPLLDNAIGHAASAVDVALEVAPAALVVAVEDDGHGLDGQDPEALFAPGRSTTGGAGLGLPLARRLARSMGGDVRACRRRGGGARFELRLPRG